MSSDNKDDPTIQTHSIKIDKTKLKTYTIPNPNQILADTAYQLVSESIKNKPLSLNNIVEITRITLNIVTNLKRGSQTLTLDEVKAVVIQIIQKQVENLPLENENRNFLINVIIPLMLPGIIDDLTLGFEVATKNMCGSCFPCCFSIKK